MYSSTILSLRAKGSPYFPFSDPSHSSLADIIDSCGMHFPSSLLSSSLSPSCRCSCCCCCCACYGHCSAVVHRVPVSHSVLYGLRQSSLLQWSASRRLLLGSGDRGYYRVPGYGVGRDLYESSCVFKERRGEGRSPERRPRRRVVCCTVSKENSEIRRSSRFKDAEAVLSLLSEEVHEESFGGRESAHGSSRKRVETENKINYRRDCLNGRKRNKRLEIGSKHKLGSVAVESKEECRSCREKRENEARKEDSNLRKDASSCSSYYSLSSSGDLESYLEEIEDDRFVENVSAADTEDSLMKERSRMKKESSEELTSNHDVREEAQVSRRKESTLRSNAEWDWRKKSEKKLDEVSVEDAKSTKESSLVHSRKSRIHEQDDQKVSASRKRSTILDKKLDLSVNLDSTGRNSYSQREDGAVGPSELRKKMETPAEVCRVCGSDVTLSSQSRERINMREENIEVSGGSYGERRDYQESVERSDQRSSGGVKIQEIDSEIASRMQRESNRRSSGGVKIQEIDSGITSSLQRESDTRVSSRKESKSFTSGSAQKREQQRLLLRDEEISKQSDLTRSQESTQLSESHQNTERTYISNRQHEEENVNLVSSSYSNHRQQHSETVEEDTYRNRQSSNESEALINKSSRQASERKTASSSERTYGEKMADRRNNITVVVNVGNGVGKNREESSQRLMQTGSQNEGRRLTKVLSSPANVPRLVRRAGDRVGDDQISPTSILTPLPSQMVVQGSISIGQTSRAEAPEGNFAGARTPELKPEVESGDGRDPAYSILIDQSAQEDALETAKPSDQLSNQVAGELILSGERTNTTYGIFVNQQAHKDALESAERSDQLSNQVVGEFIEKARDEVLTSETQTETSHSGLTNRREDRTQTGSSHFGSEIQMKAGGSRNSSNGSGAGGPSDEIWLETEASTQEPPKADVEQPEGGLESGQAIVKRTGRSLWNIIGDIVRLRFASRAETPRSASRSGKKSPSNESVGSEAWFSGREQGSTPLEAMTPSNRTQLISASTKSQVESPSSDKNRPLKEQVSSPLTSSSSSASKVTASSYLQEESDSHEDINQSESNNAPLTTELVESLTSPVRSEATLGTGDVDLSLYVPTVRMQPPVAKLTMMSGMEGKDGDLKQRKLQRNTQVPKDRFDEWEEAYMLESEQRRIDEMFMREALVEAKKAADNWEVPVGAVLVQHGKIIARGYNLVEELRDSTAHAEMICIREASSVLRSWRLADSTLYVTLEPCPMCAGAILQARIDSLVWGAPNKLLGADGSWIRLFPIGEGSSSSEIVEKPPPPAHPFHPKMNIRRGVLASECADTMQQFFQLRRRKKEKKPEEPTTPPSRLPVAPHPSKLLNKMHDMFHITFCL